MKVDVKLEKINFQYYIVIKNNIYINITKEKFEELEKVLTTTTNKNVEIKAIPIPIEKRR